MKFRFPLALIVLSAIASSPAIAQGSQRHQNCVRSCNAGHVGNCGSADPRECRAIARGV